MMTTIAHTEGIGRQIRECREAAGLSQAELAERAGLSQPHVSLIEADGRPELSIRTLMRLADALNADWCYDGRRIVFRRRKP